MPEWKIMFYFSKVCSAVCFLHSKRIVHLNIKLTNILLENSSKVKDVKLTGFDKSWKIIKENEVWVSIKEF